MTSTIELLDKLVAQSISFKNGNNEIRSDLLVTLQRVQHELETPRETFFRILWGQPALNLALVFATDIRAYEILSDDHDCPKTSQQIAAPSGADPKLVGRMMRHLATMGVVRQVDIDTFASTKLSKLLRDKVYTDSIKFILEDSGAMRPRTAGYLRSIGWQTPTDNKDCALQHGLQIAKGTNMFGWFGMYPEIGARFGNMMIAWLQNQPSWADEHAYPVQERLKSTQHQDEVLIVDIGGGKGHDLSDFRTKYPEIEGRLICQEMPYLIPEIDVKGVEPMAHDFNQPQPVKGAGAYFLHHILHDYSDAECIHILDQIVPAMKPGHSKILIAELIIPNMNAHYTSTGLDLELMQCLAASERTEAQFRDLLNKAGLKVTGIFKHPEAHESIIEARPV